MKNFSAILFLILFGSIMFLATLRGAYGNPKATDVKDNLDQPTKPLELSPERGRFLLTQNLSEHHSFALSKDQADAAYPDIGFYKGNFYIFFAPGISIFALPFYNLGLHYNLSQIFSFAIVAVFAVLDLVFIYLIAKEILKLPIWASILASLIYGFGSISWSYSGTLYQHQTTVFFILSSFYGVWKIKNGKKRGWIWGLIVWLNYALAILIDYPNAVLMLPVMIYFALVCINVKKDNGFYKVYFKPIIILTSIFFVGVTFWHLQYNKANFGGFFKTSGGLPSYKSIVEGRVASEKDPLKFFREDLLVSSSNTLLFALDKGIFIFNPIFILGVLGVIYMFKKMSLEKGVLISLILVNLFFYSSWGDPWGGWAFGPRYLILSMSILSMFTSYLLVRVKYKLLLRLAAFLLIAFSAAVSLLGALTTNAVPPITEAIYLHIPYGFKYNIPFLLSNKSGSYLYNIYFYKYFNIKTYYEILLGIVLVVVFITVFIMPIFSKKEEKND